MSKMWERVIKTEMPESLVNKINANKSTITNDIFVKSCEAVNIKPTKRQASKWNNKKGLAYNTGRHITQ